MNYVNLVAGTVLRDATLGLRSTRLPPHREGEVLCVPFPVTSAIQTALEASGWEWVDSSGARSPGAPRGYVTPSKSGRLRNGQWPVLRALLTADRRLTQHEIADATGVSQPLVASVVRTARQHGWTDGAGRRTRAGVEDWVETYPGPGGVSLPLYGRRTLQQLVSRITERCPGAVVSGAQASSRIAAWTTARRLTIYVPAMPDPSDLGLVEAAEESEATVVLTQPADTSIFSCATLDGTSGARYADLLQVSFDLAQELGPNTRTLADAREALWRTLL